MELELSRDEKSILLATARETIRASCAGENPESMVRGPLPAVFELYYGAFVTLHKQGKLRGCIGNMTGLRPLLETIIEMSKSAAFEDPRFPPVTAGELTLMDIEISVLSPLRVIRDPEEIQVGIHGIFLRRRGASGVLLPQVATEQGWDRLTFLQHTCRKAGLSGDCYKDPDTEIQIFSAVIFGEKDAKPE